MPKLNYSLRKHFIGVLFVLSTVFVGAPLADMFPRSTGMFYPVIGLWMISCVFLYYRLLYRYHFTSIVVQFLGVANIVLFVFGTMFEEGWRCFGKSCSGFDLYAFGRHPTVFAMESTIFIMLLVYWVAGRDFGLR